MEPLDKQWCCDVEWEITNDVYSPIRICRRRYSRQLQDFRMRHFHSIALEYLEPMIRGICQLLKAHQSVSEDGYGLLIGLGVLTFKVGINRVSFSSATTLGTFVSSTDRVSSPGPTTQFQF